MGGVLEAVAKRGKCFLILSNGSKKKTIFQTKQDENCCKNVSKLVFYFCSEFYGVIFPIALMFQKNISTGLGPRIKWVQGSVSFIRMRSEKYAILFFS